MDQNKKIRWGLIILVFFFIGLAVDYFFLHILFQDKMNMQQNQEQSSPPAPEQNRDGGATTTTVDPNSPMEVSQQNPQSPANLADFQAKAAQCLDSDLARSNSLDELIAELEKKNPIVKKQFQLENTHIQLADGSQRRLHLIVSDKTNHKNQLELRYYKLDADGLPERIELPEDQTYNPKPETIESLKQQGTLTYHQTKDSLTLKDGASVILTQVNNHVYEFQIFNHGKTFSCRELSCACR